MSEDWQPIDERLIQEYSTAKVPSTDAEVFALFQSFGMVCAPMKQLYIIYRNEDKMNVLDAYAKVMHQYAEM